MQEFVIGRRQLYILPTRMGWYFGLIMVALFGIAVKFDNQAAFMMLFVLISMALIGMIYTHNNVLGLGLNSQSSNSVFLGERAEFPLVIKNNSDKARHAVWVVSGGFQQVLKLNAHQDQTVKLEVPTVQRGFLNCDPISLTSLYPIGVFFCWSKRYTASKRCLVYPQPLDLIALPVDSSQAGKHENNSAAKHGNEDFHGMKQYQQGDRIRDIHWPSVSKTNKLVTIEYENLSPSSLNLSWLNLPATMNTEDRLSQLTYWVIDAEKSGARYQLEMPNNTIAYDNGPNHYHACLRTLALWGLDQDETHAEISPPSHTPGIKPARAKITQKKRQLASATSSAQARNSAISGGEA